MSLLMLVVDQASESGISSCLRNHQKYSNTVTERQGFNSISEAPFLAVESPPDEGRHQFSLAAPSLPVKCRFNDCQSGAEENRKTLTKFDSEGSTSSNQLNFDK